MFPRALLTPTESTLLLGPRGTGKSTWIRERLRGAKVYDLLDTTLALKLARDPGVFAQELAATSATSWVVVDEVQKVPALLDEVHRLIETRGLKFLLSGSSARKLRKGGSNLLAGRALRADLFPLTAHEVGAAPTLEQMTRGMLPKAVEAPHARPYLEAYCETYLREEIQAEALTRNIGAFARFLDVAARQNGMVTNVANVSREAQVARQTVQGFFEILVDTLLGFWLPAWRPKRATKVVAHPKFFLFDSGVARALSGRLPYPPTPEELGTLFETYMLHELRAWLSYSGLGYPLTYFRTHDAVEVDVLLEDARGYVAMEIKSSSSWRKDYGKGLARVGSELPSVRRIGVFAGASALRDGEVEVLPYATFLERLWAGDVVQ